MHTKDLARALRAFAMTADFDRSHELHLFANMLESGPNETIPARLKRLSQPPQYPARLKETLEAIASGLRAIGAIKQSGALLEITKLFSGRAGASVDEFCAALSSPIPHQTGSSRHARKRNIDIANAICLALASSVEDVSALHGKLEELESSSPATAATWSLAANRLIGNTRNYRDRKSAIAAIKGHFDGAQPTTRVEEGPKRTCLNFRG